MINQDFLKSQKRQVVSKNSLLKQSANLIGTLGLTIASLGLICVQVKATGNSLVLLNPEQDIPAPNINKSVKAQVKLAPPNVSVTPRSLSPTGKNNYLDTTNYSRRVNQNQGNSPSVVVSDRITGCQTTVNGGGMSKGCGGKKVITPRVMAQVSNNKRLAKRRPNTQNLTASKFERKYSNNNITRNYNRPVKANYSYVKPNYANRGDNFNQLNNPNNFVEKVIPPEYSHAIRQQNIETNGNTSLLFPLSIPASISSAFGWRLHPINGTYSMHYGTDIPAPIGTPVLAAYPGEVAIANNVDGYGLMVILRHENGTQESRYAHLSEIYVNQGEWIEQGSVIGLVGTTGFSTGPHLHFEWRHLTPSGWIAVDAGLHLQYALDNLIKSMQIAQANSLNN